MNTDERRVKLLARLSAAAAPLSGTKLSREFGVSRQIIVGDISILRAQGNAIYATPRGYIMPSASSGKLVTLVCRHSADMMEQELTAIVDNGGAILDVIVEHPVYGLIKADLLIENRRDVKNFLAKMKKCTASPLLIVTGGTHMHTIRVTDEEMLSAIKNDLQQLKILVN